MNIPMRCGCLQYYGDKRDQAETYSFVPAGYSGSENAWRRKLGFRERHTPEAQFPRRGPLLGSS
jgi:hypothetical protein